MLLDMYANFCCLPVKYKADVKGSKNQSIFKRCPLIIGSIAPGWSSCTHLPVYRAKMSHLQQGNKFRALTGGNLNSSIPLHQRDQWWIRWPAKFARGVKHALAPSSRNAKKNVHSPSSCSSLWEWFRSDVVHLFIVFVPFSLAAGSRGWRMEIVLALGVLSLTGLDAGISSSLDRICLSFDGRVPRSHFTDLFPYL